MYSGYDDDDTQDNSNLNNDNTESLPITAP